MFKFQKLKIWFVKDLEKYGGRRGQPFGWVGVPLPQSLSAFAPARNVLFQLSTFKYLLNSFVATMWHGMSYCWCNVWCNQLLRLTTSYVEIEQWKHWIGLEGERVAGCTEMANERCYCIAQQVNTTSWHAIIQSYRYWTHQSKLNSDAYLLNKKVHPVVALRACAPTHFPGTAPPRASALHQPLPTLCF